VHERTKERTTERPDGGPVSSLQPGLLQLAQQWLVAPFAEFAFMRRALVATVTLALGSGPIGCLLILRRMSLVGDAMAHAVMPGAAAGCLLAGLSLPAAVCAGKVR
jgi:zinc/manganese transport system permease protein